jgi:hypothetical protein
MGIDRVATRLSLKDEIPMCDDHAKGIPVLPPADLRPKPAEKDPVRIYLGNGEEQPMEKCKCGKQLHHRGRCAGFSITTGRPKKVVPNFFRTGRFDEMIAKLHDEKVKIEQAIALLQELNR